MTSIVINEQLSLLFSPGTPLARKARQSRTEALRALAEAIAAAQAQASPFSDWCERCLDLSDPSAVEEHDELFVSCRKYCEAVGVPSGDRPSYSAFARSMTEAGLSLERVPGGASVRRGCKFRRRAALTPMLDEEASVDTFLAERCRIAPRGGPERVRSLELHKAYCEWAVDRDRDAIGIKRFARQMELLGLRRKHSNGIWWMRVELLDADEKGAICTNDTTGRIKASPRPLVVADDTSKGEVQAEQAGEGRA